LDKMFVINKIKKTIVSTEKAFSEKTKV